MKIKYIVELIYTKCANSLIKIIFIQLICIKIKHICIYAKSNNNNISSSVLVLIKFPSSITFDLVQKTTPYSILTYIRFCLIRFRPKRIFYAYAKGRSQLQAFPRAHIDIFAQEI